MSNKALRTIVALAASAAAWTGAAHASPAPAPAHSCFPVSAWHGWNSTAGGDALYLRANLNDVYRVDLSPGSHARKGAGDFLVSKVRGSDWICSALDLDLAISDDMGFKQPLIATGLRKLSPAEVAAIPRKELP